MIERKSGFVYGKSKADCKTQPHFLQPKHHPPERSLCPWPSEFRSKWALSWDLHVILRLQHWLWPFELLKLSSYLPEFTCTVFFQQLSVLYWYPTIIPSSYHSNHNQHLLPFCWLQQGRMLAMPARFRRSSQGCWPWFMFTCNCRCSSRHSGWPKRLQHSKLEKNSPEGIHWS